MYLFRVTVNPGVPSVPKLVHLDAWLGLRNHWHHWTSQWWKS